MGTLSRVVFDIDTTPPTVPASVAATALSQSAIRITWLPSIDTGGSGLAGYRVLRSATSGGTYAQVGTDLSVASLSYDDAGLIAGATWFYRIVAFDGNGNVSSQSSAASATTQAANPGTGLTFPAHAPGYLSLLPDVGGYGMQTVAGSGRHLGTPATTVILVNTLAAGNTGAALTGLGANVFGGTFEYAWRHAASPKAIIPIVSGWVQVQDSIPCQTGTPPRPGYVSYYGQAAPNPGLFLRGANIASNGASDMAVWHLRSYMGDDVAGLGAGNRDCFSSGYGAGTTSRVVLINCEFAWSIDELADFNRSHSEVTLVNCAFIEPLHVSTIVHPEDGPGVDHGFGPIIGGDTGQTQTAAVSSFRNLWAHTTGRNPLASVSNLVHANNLHYNHGRPTGGAGNAVQIIANGATAANYANVIGNAFVRGPNNNGTFVAISVTGSFPAGSAGYGAANSQFGWTAPANQAAFFTASPAGYVASSVQAAAYPGSWGSGLTAVLQWAANPLSPTITEWNAYIDLMSSTVGAQPRYRTASIGRVSTVINQIRNTIAGVAQTDQFVDTVTEAGGWFNVTGVTIDPLNPGTHWHAPLPTGSDRDTPYTAGLFSDGKSRVGYTRLEAWAYEQHLYVTVVDAISPTVPANVQAAALSQSTIRITWDSSTDAGGSGLAGYRVFRSTTSGGTYTQVSSDLTATNFDDTTLSAGQQRFYRVVAFDGRNNMSLQSAVVSATTSTTASIAGLPFSDGAEVGNTAAWDSVGGTVTVSSAEAYSGTRSFSTLAISGQQSDNYLEKNFGDAPTVGGTPTGMNDLWIQFAHKWDAAYVDSDPNIQGQKLLLLNAHNPATGRRRYQFTFNVAGPAHAAGNNVYYIDIYRWNEDTSFGGVIHTLTIPGFPRVKGRWEEFVFRIRQNTPGASDGQLDCWTKAQGDAAYSQQLSRTNLNFRDSTNITPNRLIGVSNYDTLTTRSGRRYWDGIYCGQTPVDVSSGATWQDVTVPFAGMPAQLAGTDGRKVRLTINSSGTDWGQALGTGASATRQAGTAFDGSDCIRLVPPSIDENYAAILRFLDLTNGTKNVAQVNLGWCIKYGSRYWDLGHNDKLTGVLASQTIGGEANASASRAAIFDVAWDRGASDFRRVFSITARTVAEYFNPAQGGYWNEHPFADLLMVLSNTINHTNNPPLVGSEWLYCEQEVDYRQNRGNPFGRNRLDVWARDRYLGFLEIPLTNDPNWDFSWQYGRSLEYIGGYWNVAGTPNANNYLEVSHAIVAVNRARDARIGPPPGFLT